MAIIRPFRGIRPAKDKVHLVASSAVDSYSSAKLNSRLSENPYSFLHIIKPEFKEKVRSKPGSPELLQKIKKKFLQFIDEGTFYQDKEESFYIYQQIIDGNVSTGITACANIWDYYNGVIKVHEQTFPDRVEKLKSYLEVCDFNAEPVCLSYPDNRTIDEIIGRIILSAPKYDFTTTDRIRHKLWKASDRKTIGEITTAFEKIPCIYITDGHHRTASSALLGKTKKTNNPNHTGKEPYNFFMVVLFPESNLKVYEFNRIVKDLNYLSKEVFLKKLTADFIIEEKGPSAYRPDKKGNFSMYFDEKWYSLTIKNAANSKLDVDLLSELILAPHLGIHHLITDKRIVCVSGTKGILELKKRIDSGKATVGFGLYPVTVKDIIHMADADITMPPKSTWVEPKTGSGLVIYSLSDTSK